MYIRRSLGSRFKKSKRERKYEKQDKKMKEEAIDSKILIPESHQKSEYRTSYNSNNENNYSILGYDTDNVYGSPYNGRYNNEIELSNERIISQKPSLIPPNTQSNQSNQSNQTNNSKNRKFHFQPPYQALLGLIGIKSNGSIKSNRTK